MKRTLSIVTIALILTACGTRSALVEPTPTLFLLPTALPDNTPTAQPTTEEPAFDGMLEVRFTETPTNTANPNPATPTITPTYTITPTVEPSSTPFPTVDPTLESDDDSSSDSSGGFNPDGSSAAADDNTDYFNAITLATQLYTTGLNEIAEAGVQSDSGSVWTGLMNDGVRKVVQGYNEWRAITPPEEAADLHAQYVETLAVCANKADEYSSGLNESMDGQAIAEDIRNTCEDIQAQLFSIGTQLTFVING